MIFIKHSYSKLISLYLCKLAGAQLFAGQFAALFQTSGAQLFARQLVAIQWLNSFRVCGNYSVTLSCLAPVGAAVAKWLRLHPTASAAATVVSLGDVDIHPLPHPQVMLGRQHSTAPALRACIIFYSLPRPEAPT